MKRKKDRSGSVIALAATAIVIVLVGVSAFSLYSLSKQGYIKLPFNLSAETGSTSKALADGAADEIVAAELSVNEDADQDAPARPLDSPLRITGVVDLNRKAPIYDVASAKDTQADAIKEEPVEKEPAEQEPVIKEPVKSVPEAPAEEKPADPEPAVNQAQEFSVDEEPLLAGPAYEEPAYEEPVYSEPEQIVYADYSDEEEVQIPELSAAEEYAATHLEMEFAEPVGEESYDDYTEVYEEPEYAYAGEDDSEEFYVEDLYEEIDLEEFEEEPYYAGYVEDTFEDYEESYEEDFDEEIYYEEFEEEPYYAEPVEDTYEESYDESYYEDDYEEYYVESEEVSYTNYWDEDYYDIWTDDNGTWIHDPVTGETFNSEIGPDPNYGTRYEPDDWYEEPDEDDWYDDSYEDDQSEYPYEDNSGGGYYDDYEESYEDYDYDSDYWNNPRYEIWTDDAGVWVFDTETGELFNSETGPDPDYGNDVVEEDYDDYDDSEDYDDDYDEIDYDDSEDEDYDDYDEDDSEDYDDEYDEIEYDDYDDEYDEIEYDDEDEVYYTLGQQIVDYALGFVGVTPYVWGGNSLYGGTDCSGFVHLIFDAFGIYCSHASLDYNGGSFGYIISYDQLQPGDIVVYGGGDHVAIYAGNDYVVHCSSPENGTVYWNMHYRSDISWFLRVIY